MTGVNVNTSVKLLEEVMVNGLSKGWMKDFEAIPNKERPKLYRYVNGQALEDLIYNQRRDFLRAIVSTVHPDEPIDSSKLQVGDASNQYGADAVYGPLDIEMKFGAETNANIGMNTFLELFPGADGLFDYFSNLTERNQRKEYYANHHTEESIIAQENMDAYLAIANQFNQVYSDLTPRQVKLINQLINQSGSTVSDRPANDYLKLLFHAHGVTIIERTKDQPAYKTWAQVSDLGERSRLTIHVASEELSIRFVLNGKNTVRVTNEAGEDVVFRSKLMLGTPSFNVFVKEVEGDE